MNAAGGPVRRDPVEELLRSRPPVPEGSSIPVGGVIRHGVSAVAQKTKFPYLYGAGFLAAGNDIGSVEVESYEDALALCTADITCKGITYKGPRNFTDNKTKVYLKKSSRHQGG